MKIRSVVATGLLITVAFVAHAADEAPHWGYGGEHGPKKWGDMEAGFSACKLGKEQSPIDIRNAKKSALPALDFKYTKSSAEVVNNGHTIQVNLVDGGVLNLDGVPYGLVQFHFHAPSEEKIVLEQRVGTTRGCGRWDRDSRWRRVFPVAVSSSPANPVRCLS